jgi:hypothetical protein
LEGRFPASFVARGISLQPTQENAEKEAMNDFL